MCWNAIVDLYERHAQHFDRDRSRSLQEKIWLDRFLNHVRPSGVVLDIGCGMAEPIARHVLEAGFRVVGIDSSPATIEMCQARLLQVRPPFRSSAAESRPVVIQPDATNGQS